MIAALIHAVAIGALGVLVRRRIADAPAAWRWAAGAAGALAAAVLVNPTQARVYAATTGFDAEADLVASAAPAGDFVGAVLLAAAVVLALPWVRGMVAGNGAAPLECCAANDLNHRP